MRTRPGPRRISRAAWSCCPKAGLAVRSPRNISGSSGTVENRKDDDMFAKLLLILLAALPPPPEGIQPTGGKIGWCSEKDYDVALARAKHSGKPVILYFTANWSGPDRSLGAGAFSDDQVMEASWGFVRVVIPYVAEPKKNPALDLVFAPLDSKPLPEKWAITGFPTLVFLNPDRREG